MTICEEPDYSKLEQYFDKDNILSGIPYLAKDNFWTMDLRTTAGSKILSNFQPTEDSTVIKKLRDKSTVLLGKTTLDELGMGGTGLFGFNGKVANPFDTTRIAGGSSSGSAYAVAKGYVPFATGSDTGDSIRKPASFVGVVGFKPTYGSLSRYGVIPYAPSLDHLGYFTRNVEDMALVCDATYGFDKKDFTSIANPADFASHLNDLHKNAKFGYIKDVQKYIDGKLAKAYEKLYQKIKADGHEVIEIDFSKKLLDALPAVYMMISFSEAVSTHSNLDGINFGERVEGKDYIETIKKSRASGFGMNVKKDLLLVVIN
ncbi:aspartyl/glutamyl-tRNA amidotransferase subunit A [Spiroplasma clarkii]|uniref:amidase family protein n=1 Tax=Spiroplasma clarkii TaxID=2139 RepID=UPI000B550611|nr:amidase family protein [Spiroplasma clarkii]ARU92232.1 aspartyl/glutamyl-tRNA amidotransferase subunit A [Spiroplasma clarkii]